MHASTSLTVLTLVAIISALATYHISRKRTSTPPRRPQGFVVNTKVTHSRLLPESAAHNFSYPTLFLLVSLRALEAGRLDLCRGWLFSYGGLYGRVTGLRASAYLQEDPTNNVWQKLGKVLTDHGANADELGDAWMLTMPSYFGFEGINPLTVYFCYKTGGEPSVVVLEIHNTFGEKHVHVLQVGCAEDPKPDRGFTHQWTFLREFHVSPFNDRSGFYKISVNMPVSPVEACHGPAPMPRVRVHLHTRLHQEDPEKTVGPLKLAASMTTTASAPLTTANLVYSLLTRPFVLLLSMPRILYQAWILHYRKRLNVFVRPDPHPVSEGWGGRNGRGGGVGWQAESGVEAYARGKVEGFVQWRVRETHIAVTMIPASPMVARQDYTPEEHQDASQRHLTISYLSPAFCTLLYTAPSISHGIILCQSLGLCHISSGTLCKELLIDGHPTTVDRVPLPLSACRPTYAQRIRIHHFPDSLRNGDEALAIPHSHPLDPDEALSWAYLRCIFVLLLHFSLECIEKWLYKITRAEFVPGQEPWLRWDHVKGMLNAQGGTRGAEGSCGVGLPYTLGSFQRTK